MTLRKTRHLDAYLAIKELSEEHDGYPVSEMCRILGINRAAYYKWKSRGNGQNDTLNEIIAQKAEQIHSEHPDMGYRRIRDTLEHDHGIYIDYYTIRRVQRNLGVVTPMEFYKKKLQEVA